MTIPTDGKPKLERMARDLGWTLLEDRPHCMRRQRGADAFLEQSMKPVAPVQTMFEGVQPILRVENMQASLRFYVDILGFKNAEWGTDDFTSINHAGGAIYLCRGDQGRGGAWLWIGVDDVEELCQELKARGVRILLEPTNYPWAPEMRVEDPDGNVLRFGSEPRRDTKEAFIR